MSDPFRIKVCGITSEDAARAAVEAGADHLGIVFCPSVRRLSLERAVDLVTRMPAAWVGVFADAPVEELDEVAVELGLAAIQLHGRETPDFCRSAREATGLPVWKAIVPDAGMTGTEYRDAADILLLDGERGGSGRMLDWDALGAAFPRSSRRGPVLLAGGLDPDNVATAIRAADPDGVDASSGLESAPGVKDPDRVREFVLRARAAAAEAVSRGASR